MNIVIPALAFLLVSAIVMGTTNIQGPEEAQQIQISVNPLKLEKPSFTWTRCNCPNGTEMGLTENDFIVFQMYLQGLEHQVQTCQGEFYWPPSTRIVQK